jgi:LmbE family N-acetylglucosaminyl deacetylase
MLIALVSITAISFLGWLFLRTVLTVPPEKAIENGHELLSFKKVLVIVAHPDDMEWWTAGTLALLVQNGAKIRAIVASSGEGGRDVIGVEDLAQEREQEQMRASQIIGFDNLEFLRYPDRRVPQRIRETWDEFQPDVVLTFDPEFPALPYLHPDHEGTGRIVLRVWRQHYVDNACVFVFHSRRPNTVVDISDVFEIKKQALSQHKTQGLNNFSERIYAYNRAGQQFSDIKFAEFWRKVTQ